MKLNSFLRDSTERGTFFTRSVNLRISFSLRRATICLSISSLEWLESYKI